MIIETNRLFLREYKLDDYDALYEIVSDAETMQHYPEPFNDERTKNWINWNLDNYKKYGFGLWAVVLKETGEFIGDCGITIQNIDGEMLPEIGYHIHKKYWRCGFGKEAARTVRDWVFNNTDYDCIYSYMKYTNIASYKTAIANGMRKVKEYSDPKNTISYAYAITREEWKKIMDKYTAYCGLNCKTCEARLATVNNDNEIRKKVAAEWSKLNQVEILPEMINCEGCRLDGVKTPFCDSLCEIKKCAIKNNMETCRSCGEMSSCTKFKMISDNNDVFSH